MYRILFLLLLIAVGAVGAASVFRLPADGGLASARSTVVNEPIAVNEPIVETPATSNLTQEKDGIEIAITNIEQRADATVLTLALNNHSYDLAEETIYREATLDGKPSQSFTILSDGAGGHHVDAEIIFEKTTKGLFKIAPGGQTVFSFDELW